MKNLKKAVDDYVPKELEQIVDDTIEEVSNLKEDEEIYPEVAKLIEEDNVTNEMKKEFEVVEKMIKQGQEVISNTDLYRMLLKLQVNINDVDKNVQDKKLEQINLYKQIFYKLKSIKIHMSKWFIGILVITFLSGGVVFTTVYHNWDTLTPAIDKLTSIFNFANSAKRIVN